MIGSLPSHAHRYRGGFTAYGEPISAAAAGIISGSIVAAGAITTAVITGAQGKRARAEARLMMQEQARIEQLRAQQAAQAVRHIPAQSSISPWLVVGVVAIPVVAWFALRGGRR